MPENETDHTVTQSDLDNYPHLAQRDISIDDVIPVDKWLFITTAIDIQDPTDTTTDNAGNTDEKIESATDIIVKHKNPRTKKTVTVNKTKAKIIADNGQPSTDNITKTPKTKKQPKPNDQKLRVTATTALNNTDEFPEWREIDKIVKARVEAGITRDWNHFLRQCLDFSVNYNYYKNLDHEQNFGVPENTSLIQFKDAFTNNEK
jgi:hypothetical protein